MKVKKLFKCEKCGLESEHIDTDGYDLVTTIVKTKKLTGCVVDYYRGNLCAICCKKLK